jgi:hypothetical protein
MCDMLALKLGKIVCITLFAKVFALGSPAPLISFVELFQLATILLLKLSSLCYLCPVAFGTGLVGNIIVSAARSIVLAWDNNAAPSEFDGNARFDSNIIFTFLAK